ncbi:exocyst complex component EXO70E2-like [Henckelia pumila]|uniref:exocyst complex component EXO70E2-like n=1 Tax=Henckelia pumila TaxID=405737 RepID=UPI003C6E36D0
MEDSELVDGVFDGQQHLILVAYHSVKALESTGILNQDMKKNVATLCVELSKMIGLNEGDEEDDNKEIEDRLASAHDMIVNLQSNHSRIWDSGPSIVGQYLKAIDDVRSLAQSLESVVVVKRSRKKMGILNQAQSIQQIAMVRLQEELVHILDQNKQCFGHENVLLPVCEEGSVYEESIISNDENSVENASQRASSGTEAEEYLMDLVHPDMIPQIKSIAKTMFDSGYDQEFCLAFVKFWRETMAEYLAVLNIERLRIADVLAMEWKCLNSRIRKWRRAMSAIIGVYLASAKRLFDQVLGQYGCTSSICFVEASKASVLGLLDFGQAVALGPHRPEWLYCFLGMHDVLVALIPNAEALYPQETGLMIKNEFHELLDRLGDSAKATFMGFGNYIESSSSTTLSANGGIHPLIKYTVNYMIWFADYGDTLDSLLEENDAVADHLRLFTSILEGNLDKQSNLYQDHALKQIFLMNNMHYMVQKFRSSGVGTYLGDDWIREHICKYRKYAMCYERTTWSSMLPLLRDDGKRGKATLKTRSHAFYTAFEDLYRNQTGWCVPDPKLREELRISASKTVIHPYRTFLRIISDTIGDKYVKYTEQDLETYILDLLDSAPKSLNHLRRR